MREQDEDPPHDRIFVTTAVSLAVRRSPLPDQVYDVSMRWVLALVTAAGCYGPSPNPGAPCAPGGVCPDGLECRADLCVLPGTPPDGRETDAPNSDGPPPDTSIPDGPNLTGCADGEREGFADVTMFPTIAGCKATWLGLQDLRAAKTGGACGDDSPDPCAVPADACDVGWSMCGLDGSPSSLTTRATDDQCTSAGGGTGAFAAAMSHCTLSTPCEYATPYPCMPSGDCSEPVCCGPDCSNNIGCPDGVYQAATRVGGNNTTGCGALDASTVTGVLCCKD